MYRLLILFTVFLCIQPALCQKRTRAYTLKEPEEKITHSLYNKIAVLDKRDIQDNLGVIQVGVLNAKAQVIAEPSLEIQIQNQLQKMVSGSLQKGELVLRIEKFCIAEMTGMVSEAGYFDFTGTLFAKVADDAYVELATLDTAVVIKRMDVTLGILNSSSKVINKFLAKNLQRTTANESRFTWTEVDDYDTYLKTREPLYNVSQLADGLYKNFEEFRLQQPSGGLVQLKKNDLKRGVFTMNEEGKLKKVAFKDCYAFVIDHVAYINCLSNYCRLDKNNDDFCFVGPAKIGATASEIVAASLFMGAIGGAIAGSGSLATYYQKIDFRNGKFIRLERR